jgi:hypothetical protein
MISCTTTESDSHAQGSLCTGDASGVCLYQISLCVSPEIEHFPSENKRHQQRLTAAPPVGHGRLRLDSSLGREVKMEIPGISAGAGVESVGTVGVNDGEQILENLKTGRYTFLVGNDGNFIHNHVYLALPDT